MNVHFGVTLPQIKRSWEDTRAAALEFERLGYDSVWLNDHLYGIPAPGIPILEAWTTLSAVGAVTSRVRLGTLVSPVGFRPPALFAKAWATLDTITGGRVIAGFGAGWYDAEFRGYGLPFPSVRERLEQLEEALALSKLLWTQERTNFAGKHFRLESTFCEPKPVQKPHPPLLVGGGGERVLLRIAARHADIWNNLAVTQDQLGKKVESLRRHCEQVGRDFSTLTVSQQCLVVLGETEKEAAANAEKAQRIYGGHMGGQGELAISGTPDVCIEKIRRHLELGCRMFVIEFFGKDTRVPARLFAERVMPAFRN
ncbi:MAG: hypothetical protein KatS3mg076_3031 [Candidatus Binatia bacterium]|nr:MAG: hypothetical protein KatS3mg076_3031 [Candidatus Binatia bacterium]